MGLLELLGAAHYAPGPNTGLSQSVSVHFCPVQYLFVGAENVIKI